MKISEIELKSGMERTNIRFYEREGLISPLRKENGYREFTEEDLETLLRIKLLRSIHVPLNQIKTLIDGETSLMEILDHQLIVLESEKGDINFAQNVCIAMKKEETSLYQLDAKKYLDQLDKKVMESGTEYFSMEKDILPQVFNPWRRYLARMLDYSLYALLLSTIRILFFHRTVVNQSVVIVALDTLIILGLMLFIEPFFLSVFGTTPGKAIFGLRVESAEGNKITYYDAFHRTYGVLRYGMGFQIPIYSQIRQFKSYQKCSEGKTLSWDELVSYTIKDKKTYRSVLFVGATGILIVGAFILTLAERIPPHRGELTVSEFTENYNYYKDYFEMDLGEYELHESGEWMKIEVDRESGYYDYIDIRYQEKPIFWYELSGDKIKGIEYNVAIEGVEEPILSYKNHMLLTYLALVGAQREVNLFSSSLVDVGKTVENHTNSGYSFEKHGLKMNWDVAYEGYEIIADMFYPDYRAKEYSYEVSYSILKP